MGSSNNGFSLIKSGLLLSASLASDGDLKFYFHPCYDVPLGNDSSGNSCGKSSVCLYNETSKNHTTLGTADEATFVSTSINDPLYLHYKHADTSTIIWLRCSLDVSSNLVAHIESNKSYTLTLSSREVCPLFVPTGSNTSIWIPAAKLLENASTTTTTTTIPPPTSTPIPVHPHSGLSTGSLLVILFITFSSIYFFGGVLALKLLRGAEGKEMIPNYDFWADVPYLCRKSSESNHSRNYRGLHSLGCPDNKPRILACCYSHTGDGRTLRCQSAYDGCKVGVVILTLKQVGVVSKDYATLTKTLCEPILACFTVTSINCDSLLESCFKDTSIPASLASAGALMRFSPFLVWPVSIPAKTAVLRNFMLSSSRPVSTKTTGDHPLNHLGHQSSYFLGEGNPRAIGRHHGSGQHWRIDDSSHLVLGSIFWSAVGRQRNKLLGYLYCHPLLGLVCAGSQVGGSHYLGVLDQFQGHGILRGFFYKHV
ncbi:unnamed protein product [Timema podura]|uniref:Autophagy-related protein 27 n=1 Tax=Timema podura TaxID=61482 RepID=A0ABN7NNX6_TIMPD|nr:unnamed protein product [Timema podura]